MVTISTGGLQAMATDLSIPEEYGIYQTVGDTVGPGGLSPRAAEYPRDAEAGTHDGAALPAGVDAQSLAIRCRR